MSALAEALAAAQRRALAAASKTYVHSPLSAEELDAEKERVRAIMDAIGCTDTVEQGQLLAALVRLRGRQARRRRDGALVRGWASVNLPDPAPSDCKAADVRVRPVVAWFDLWVGVYYDRVNRSLYVLPLPCLGVRIDFGRRDD